jgi:hypothetical protein
VRLPTVNGTYADYPDSRQDTPFCLEVVSQAPRYGYGTLLDEVSALAAASLCLQIDTGRAVLKVLNLSAAVGSPEIHFPSLLNFLAGSTEERHFAPVEVLSRAHLSQSGPVAEYLSSHHTDMIRIDRFRAAVGMGGPIESLEKPTIHLSLDSGCTDRPLPEIDACLQSVALWWTSFEDPTRRRFFRPQANPAIVDTGRLMARVPLPYSRHNDLETRGHFEFRTIQRPDRATEILGASIGLTAPALGADEYARELMTALVEHNSALVTSRANEAV